MWVLAVAMIGTPGIARTPARALERPVRFVDLTTGSGPTVNEGDVVRIRFLAVRRDGKEVANSLRRGMDYSFVVGGPGSDASLAAISPGIRVGGERLIWIDANTSVDVTVVAAKSRAKS